MDRKTFIGVLGSISFAPVIGRAMAVNAPCRTQRDQEGPFYKANAPARTIIETDGIPLHVEGRILSGPNCDQPVAAALIDIWHCDKHGEYDMDGFRGRGQVVSDKDGNYSFNTIVPPPYGNRPKHIHVKVRAPGKNELTTQIYFKGDPNLKNDFARSARADRVVTLTGTDQKTAAFNIYL